MLIASPQHPPHHHAPQDGLKELSKRTESLTKEAARARKAMEKSTAKGTEALGSSTATASKAMGGWLSGVKKMFGEQVKASEAADAAHATRQVLAVCVCVCVCVRVRVCLVSIPSCIPELSAAWRRVLQSVANGGKETVAKTTEPHTAAESTAQEGSSEASTPPPPPPPPPSSSSTASAGSASSAAAEESGPYTRVVEVSIHPGGSRCCACDPCFPSPPVSLRPRCWFETLIHTP